MFQIQKAKGRNNGNISQKKNMAIIKVKGIPMKRNNKPLPICPAYIWPKPGIISESTVAKPEFLVPAVTLETGISLCVGITFRGLPQYGHTFISSVTSFPHLGQKGKPQSPSEEGVSKVSYKRLMELSSKQKTNQKRNKATISSITIFHFKNIPRASWTSNLR
jgi:hypothetical protein